MSFLRVFKPVSLILRILELRSRGETLDAEVKVQHWDESQILVTNQSRRQHFGSLISVQTLLDASDTCPSITKSKGERMMKMKILNKPMVSLSLTAV